MSFYLVTPSYNQVAFLRRCSASIQDQEGVNFVHHVLDGGSTDGTVEWLQAHQISHISEPDGGMYDALNKGLTHALERDREWEYFGWLNADEQYLPAVLRTVDAYFRAHPHVDIVCGDVLLVNNNGELIAFWKSMPLRRSYLRTGILHNLTCATFFRRRILAGGIQFKPQYKAIADWVLMQELLAAGARSACVPAYLAAYTYLDTNLSNQPVAENEREALRQQAPLWQRTSIPLVRLLKWGERIARGGRRQRFPLTYEIYHEQLDRRSRYVADHALSTWPR